MGVPTVEKAPGIKEPWLGMWRYALADMKDSGVWSPVLRPLLDEMIECRRLQREHLHIAEGSVEKGAGLVRRAHGKVEEIDGPRGVETNRESGLTHMHAGFASSRAYGKRAQEIAVELALTPKAKKALVEKADDPHEEDPAFAAADRLARGTHAPRRRSRVAHP